MPGRFLHRRAQAARLESQRLVGDSKARLAELIATAEALATTVQELDPADDVLRDELEGRALALAATIAAGKRELSRLEGFAEPEDELGYDPFPPRSISPDPEERRYNPPA